MHGSITQRTKYDHIVASFAPEFATEIKDLSISPPPDDTYDVLKGMWTKTTTTSQHGKLLQFPNAEEVADQKPTQLLCRMQQWLGDRARATDIVFLRQIYLQCLPGHISMV